MRRRRLRLGPLPRTRAASACSISISGVRRQQRRSTPASPGHRSNYVERMPLLVVSKNLGHADTRMVGRHYGHLLPSYIADAICAGAPKFGFKPDPKIAALVGKPAP